MAEAVFKRKDIILEFGVVENGKAEKRRITLSNVRDDMTPDEIYQVGIVLGDLVKHPLLNIELNYAQYIEN
ncbi:DUF1659 domain-containing protein [Lysinibacillus antri]|uniref:DUF1659 domain-containing protein n=1 Tax=Lysinibacillus antri TaxID=2498145 RepID=A0A3S0PLX3_9BACI|nr:DUF1659 domain-containing protein [Lysinibacillus antri]RUL46537.1 DUF1659 domain-containing protein [Lysinibacillus antri]